MVPQKTDNEQDRGQCLYAFVTHQSFEIVFNGTDIQVSERHQAAQRGRETAEFVFYELPDFHFVFSRRVTRISSAVTALAVR